ncbi:hypothetical protein Sta7437_1302 [Stanieria cyanosphaera PCC 7437]|uniref:Uncharacterized protein n=1 Tax=Stanieria cyanosphaera (strain ATCC 29371 / PCC 7437) TaxID=111780 RepID=K9XT78_STAC7|nr:hypothetical protein [Stanieria cyanosphaera]AFZ34872.1 hypothetical protein Sta7437_1302 [Stanieria cyanosphaera PCC 7437]
MISFNFFKTKFNQTIFYLTTIVFCGASIIYLQMPMARQLMGNNTKANFEQDEKIAKIQLDLLKNMPSFGFKNLLSDWIMLQFLQYFGDGEARKVVGFSLSPDYLEAIVQHDPKFIQAYLMISPASSMFAGLPNRTVEAMAKGLEQLSPDISDAYYVWLYKGVDEILFIADTEEAKKSYTMASKWAKIAGNEAIAKSASDTVQFLETNPDSTDAQIGAWLMVFVNSRDTYTRQLAKNSIENLGGELQIKPDGRVSVRLPREENVAKG